MYQVSLMYANFRLSTQNNLKSCFKQLKTPSKRLHVQVLSSFCKCFYMLFQAGFAKGKQRNRRGSNPKQGICKCNFELNFRSLTFNNIENNVPPLIQI